MCRVHATAASGRRDQPEETRTTSARITPSLTAPAGFGAPAAPACETLWAVPRRIWVTGTTWNQLAALDERLLHDLGLTKVEVVREIARAPWNNAPMRRGDQPC
jgi:uncharacterized protein YjiS (DUF1127 family)